MYGYELQKRLARRYGVNPEEGMLKEAFDQRLIKALQVGEGQDAEDFAALMFVDIANFSEKVRGYDAKAVRQFLDGYYELALRRIYEHGGHVDRIIGDGVLAVFSPFLGSGTDARGSSERALGAASGVVSDVAGTLYESKAALACGSVLFCATGLRDVYEDYTIIGNPLTVTYRVEEIGKARHVMFPRQSELGDIVDAQLRLREQLGVRSNPKWLVAYADEHLRGVGTVELTVQSLVN